MVSLGRWSCHFALVVLFALTIHRPAMGEDWPPITPDDRSMTNLPEQPGAAAVVLLREDVSDDPHNNRTVYMRIKVLTEPGRRYADVEIPYSRRHFTIKDVSGRTVHSDGSIVPFTSKPFDKVIVRRKEHGFEQRYNVKSFTLPDVQVGSILEYRYELSYDDHVFFAPQWDVQIDLFQKKATFKFIPYSGYLRFPHDRVGFRAGFTRFLPKGSEPAEHQLLYSGPATSRTAASSVDLEMTNVPPLTSEPDAPPEEARRYRVSFFYMVGAKQEQYWKDEGKFWSKDVETFLGRKNGVSEAVTQTVGASDTPEQKARKIYAFVTKLDNWSYQPQRTEQEERALDIKEERGVGDVLRQHGGSHDDLNHLYVAMLRAAGIPASLMWVPSRDNWIFEPALLSTWQLSAEIVIAQLNGKDVFLDPGTKFCPYGLVDWRYSNVQGIRQREGNDTEIVESGSVDYSQASIERMARLQVTPDGKATGTVNVGYYGLEALERRRAGGKTDAEGRKKLLEDEVKSWLPADSDVSLTNAPSWDATDGQMGAEFKISCPLAVGAGKRWIVPAHLFQVNQKPRYSASDRTNPVYFDYLWREIDEIHLTLPPEFAVESVPPSDTIQLDYARYRTIQKQESANSVMAVRDLIVGRLAIPTNKYKEVKGFFDKVKAGDDQPVVAKAAAHAELR